MAKKTKTITHRNACDRMFSQLVRARGACQRCYSTTDLECAHIVPRTYAWTRSDTDNAWCLCAKCHRLTHRDVREHVDLAYRTIGRDLYDSLWYTARQGVGLKFDWAEERARLKALHAELAA